jgi:hypothetical protein
MAKSANRSKVSFLTISAFKKAIGGTFRVVHSEKTDKISVLDEFDTFYRCQQSLDVNKPMAFLLEEGLDIEDACLVNVSGTGESPLTTRYQA